jgi:NhaP-type Na+/H+ or K+/H+ antiporter
MLPVGLAMIGTGALRPTVAFLGWFGPRGLASIVFALLLVEEGGLPNDEVILVVTFVTVGLSVFAHGVSAAPLTRRYSEWLEAHPRKGRTMLEDEDDPND